VHFDSGHNNGEAMALFEKLYVSCGNMPPPEVGTLMKTAGDYVDNPDCDIDTSMIMSSDVAAAPCTEDANGLCAASLSQGMASCEDNYCPTCDQAHVCDATCEIPCVETQGGAAGKPPPPPAAEACQTNMGSMCDAAISAKLATCENDYCVTCPRA
jgi:hypothetical protein